MFRALQILIDEQKVFWNSHEFMSISSSTRVWAGRRILKISWVFSSTLYDRWLNIIGTSTWKSVKIIALLYAQLFRRCWSVKRNWNIHLNSVSLVMHLVHEMLLMCELSWSIKPLPTNKSLWFFSWVNISSYYICIYIYIYIYIFVYRNIRVSV